MAASNKNGNQVQVPQVSSKDLYLETGSTGLTRFGGWVYEEWLQNLRGIQGIKVYKEMRDNDPVVGAMLFAIEMLVREVTWDVEPAGDQPADDEAKEFLETCMRDMAFSWHDTITEILSFLVFGWSWHEVVYKRRMGSSQDPARSSRYNDGRISWRKIPIRAQETFWRWEFDEAGDTLAMHQIPPPDYTLRIIPMEKSLLFRTKANKNNPEGRSILRNAYRPWFFKKNIEEIEAIGIERDLAGLPFATVPPELMLPDASPAKKALYQAIQTMVRNVRRDELEGMVFPAAETPDGKKTGYSFELLSSGGGRRQFDTNQIITRYNQAIAMTTMADFILLGHAKVGTMALASSKTELFSKALGAFLDCICEVFNTDAIPKLFALNAFPGITDIPKLVHGDVETPDLGELGTYITALAHAHMPLFPDDQLEDQLRLAAHLPTKKPDSQAVPAVAPGNPQQQQDAQDAAPAGGKPPAKPAAIPGSGQKPEPAQTPDQANLVTDEDVTKKDYMAGLFTDMRDDIRKALEG